MKVSNKIVLQSADASVNQTSSPYLLDQVYGLAVQAVFTGSPTGAVHLEGSCDYGMLPSIAGSSYGAGIVNWATILNSTQSVSAAGIVDWNMNGVFYRWIRVVYVASSGTGTITATINTKGA